MKTLRSLLRLLIVGSLVVVGLAIWLHLAPSPEDRAPSPQPGTSADLKLDRVHYTETREGVKEWELEAASAAYFKEENLILLERVKATFFGNNEESYVLVGTKGRFNTQTKLIELYEGVKIDSSEGYHLRTQSLKYLADKRELSTTDPVEMSGPDLHVEGTGMVVELERKRLRVLGGVTTTFSSPALKRSTRRTW